MAAAPVELRGWEWGWLDRAGTLRDRRRLDANPGERIVALSIATDTRVGGQSAGGTVLVWDLPSGRVLWRRPGNSIAVSAAGGAYAVVNADRSIDLCDLETGQPRWRAAPPPGPAWAYPAYLYAQVFARDGSLLALGYDGHPGVTLLDVATGRPTRLDTDGFPWPRFLAEGPGMERDGVRVVRQRVVAAVGDAVVRGRTRSATDRAGKPKPSSAGPALPVRPPLALAPRHDAPRHGPAACGPCQSEVRRRTQGRHGGSRLEPHTGRSIGLLPSALSRVPGPLDGGDRPRA